MKSNKYTTPIIVQWGEKRTRSWQKPLLRALKAGRWSEGGSKTGRRKEFRRERVLLYTKKKKRKKPTVKQCRESKTSQRKK